MDTQSSSRRALKPAQEQKVAEDWPAQKRDRARRAAETLEQRSEKAKGDRTIGMLFKLLVKEKLLYSGKVHVNAELRPLRREKQGTEVLQQPAAL